MFYAHSSLVERAGKIERNHRTQTILPIVYAPAGDITAYLPTNVMSMTDGQWILDMKVFRDTMRPAVNTGLSVTRVGGVGQGKRHKLLAGQTAKAIAAFRAADEFAHFGSELSTGAKHDLDGGKMLFELMNQIPGETYNVMQQQLMLDIILNRQIGATLDIKKMKQGVAEHAARVVEDDKLEGNFDQIRDELRATCIIESGAPPPLSEEEQAAADAAAEEAKAAEEAGKDDKKKDKKDKKHDKTEQEAKQKTEENTEKELKEQEKKKAAETADKKDESKANESEQPAQDTAAAAPKSDDGIAEPPAEGSVDKDTKA